MQLLNSREPEIHRPKILVPELIVNEGEIDIEKLKYKYAGSNLISAELLQIGSRIRCQERQRIRKRLI
jgi:hypothetical protein